MKTRTLLRSVTFLLALAECDASARDRGIVAAGATIKQDIRGGEADAFGIHLAADDSVHVVVQQRGIDLLVSLFSPAGDKLVELDSPIGAVGPEPLWIVAKRSGEYRLEVRSLDPSAPAGRYELHAGNPRPAELAQSKCHPNLENVKAEGFWDIQ